MERIREMGFSEDGGFLFVLRKNIKIFLKCSRRLLIF